ncbi:MAG: TonB-dependent receptor [Cytophagales bacterium]|nr:MAG: TonB-dependent receptor [Cytophagales bacterium]TAF61222.1 MAG: TonB-dependent receptor [Cytophagales bacterium]
MKTIFRASSLLHILFTIALLFGFSWSALAQKGFVRGIITDATDGEALIGATVRVAGTGTGTIADLDGKYSLELVEGTYALEISYTGYTMQPFADIQVKKGTVVELNAALFSQTEEVVVEGKRERSSESALIIEQKKSAIIQDGISSQQFSNIGSSDAADAARRVTSVTLEGGKYVYVRGLGDRYSKTTLNSAEIPGLDPNRNTVQMDLFPSNMIDNLVVYKTYSPDLPASFTGGAVNITTKDFPTRFTFQLSNSFAYNTQASLNANFLSYQGGKYDWLGVDDGTRAIPSQVLNGFPTFAETKDNPALAQELDEATKSFSSDMEARNKRSFLDHSHSVSVGNQFQLFGKTFGYVAALSYQRSFNYYNDGFTGRYTLAGNANLATGLTPRYELGNSELYTGINERGSESILRGAIMNISAKLNARNKLSLNIINNHSGDKVAGILEGVFDDAGSAIDPNTRYRTSFLQFTERGLTSAQLKGTHVLGGRKVEIDWIASGTISKQNEPDLRFFTSDYTIIGGEKVHRVQSALYPVPSRYFRDMTESNIDIKANLTIPYKFKGRDSKLKFGSSYVFKDRDFNEKRFDYVNSQNDTKFTGNPNDYISRSNLGIRSGDAINGIYLRDNTQRTNSYVGTESVLGVYALTDMQLLTKLRVLAGVRMEQTNIEVISDNPSRLKGLLDNTDFLPALNATYQHTDKTNFRMAYGRTLARPVFRELAPFPTFDFIGDFILVGNPDLQRTLVDNFDLRWETYPRPSELITVSAFYKNFQNPVERVINPQATNLEMIFRNVEKATVYGVEVEVRKNLDFIKALKYLTVSGNVSLIRSIINIDPQELISIRATDPDRAATRAMYGQSPYMINASINYDNTEAGKKYARSINLSYNVFGERLAVVSANGTPNVFEKPRPSLDLSVSQRRGRLKATLRARNLLDPEQKMTQELKGKEYIFNTYRLGRSFSFGVTYTIE